MKDVNIEERCSDCKMNEQRDGWIDGQTDAWEIDKSMSSWFYKWLDKLIDWADGRTDGCMFVWRTRASRNAAVIVNTTMAKCVESRGRDDHEKLEMALEMPRWSDSWLVGESETAKFLTAHAWLSRPCQYAHQISLTRRTSAQSCSVRRAPSEKPSWLNVYWLIMSSLSIL